MIGIENGGFMMIMTNFEAERLGLACYANTLSELALNEALAYAKNRSTFGKPLSKHQVIRHKLADMATNLVAARQMVRLGAFKLDSGDPEATLFCAMAKRFATDACFEVANEALQLHGGYGYIREYPLERYLRDLRVHQILEGTNEIMRLIVARRVLEAGVAEAMN